MKTKTKTKTPSSPSNIVPLPDRSEYVTAIRKAAATILRANKRKGFDLSAAINAGWAKGGLHATASTMVVDYLMLKAAVR